MYLVRFRFVRPTGHDSPADSDSPWIVAAGRAIGRYQPLLILELARALLTTLAMVPLIVLTSDRFGNVALSRSLVGDPTEVERRGLDHGALGVGAIALSALGGAIVSAIIFIALARAFFAGRAVIWPGWPRGRRMIMRVTAVYILAAIVQTGLAIFSSNASEVAAPLVFVFVIGFVLVFGFADIACVSDGIGPLSGCVASIAFIRRLPGQTTGALSAIVLLQLIAAAAASGLVDNAHDVTLAFLPAWLVAQAVLAYIADITLLELWRRRPVEAPIADSAASREPGSAG